MSNKTNSIRGVHVSPGIYTKETVLANADKALGITALGLAGETLKGPAFQRIDIADWNEFVQLFGGTSTAKYKASNYPKYELPYIAQSYLTESKKLSVVRTLGLSGVNAGPAWVITAKGKEKGKYDNMAVAVLRSRGEHKKALFKKAADPKNNICNDVYEYDAIDYYASTVELNPSKALSLKEDCSNSYKNGTIGYDDTNKYFIANSLNYGTFTITVNGNKKYAVTLNPSDKNYILKVLGTSPEDGNTEVYVEELYDVAHFTLVNSGEIVGLNKELVGYPNRRVVSRFKPVDDLLTEDPSMLRRSMVGQRFLYGDFSKDADGNGIKVRKSKEGSGTWTKADGQCGHIYTVTSIVNASGVREYFYGEKYTVDDKSVETYADALPYVWSGYDEKGNVVSDKGLYFMDCVKCLADDSYYVFSAKETTNEVDGKNVTVISDKKVVPITLDLNNYREPYRYSSTPWFLSELHGSAEHVELFKLFRFHTISDGDNSIQEIKVSIEKINPELGTFDVLVRDFYDTDASKKIIERYQGCNLVPGDSNYIAYKIGSFDGNYVSKSKYITVEVNENERTSVSVPCGFMGYPMRYWAGQFPYVAGDKTIDSEKTPVVPYFQYNTAIDYDVRPKKQYFGISDRVGIDTDVLNYKGVEAYVDIPEGHTPCFHLDSRILNGVPVDGQISEGEKDDKITQTVSIDGVDGYSWSTVSRDETVNDYGVEPRIGTEEEMEFSIYEDIRYRKFTVAFYGGWDGWDYYRTSRSNSDDFTYQNYRGYVNSLSGEGSSVSVLKNPDQYGFDPSEKCLTSDYYAYLYAIRKFSNPSESDINVLATPGIDYVNNQHLSGAVIDMIEDERADSVYVITTPDKPFGASDSEFEMYTAQQAVENLEDSEIDSNYCTTFYPNVKYFDSDNSQYIYLPPTRDVVRNLALTDNTKFPWFAAAGWQRGTLLYAEGAKKTLKIDETDTLYGGRINYINRFAKEGWRLWGDKNLQIEENVMDRLSKRRLVLRIRKLIAIACIGLIFDPNDPSMGRSLNTAISSVMQTVASNKGVVKWKVEIDDSQETRDRLTLGAKLYIKPMPNLEYIEIEMIMDGSGISFVE